MRRNPAPVAVAQCSLPPAETRVAWSRQRAICTMAFSIPSRPASRLVRPANSASGINVTGDITAVHWMLPRHQRFNSEQASQSCNLPGADNSATKFVVRSPCELTGNLFEFCVAGASASNGVNKLYADGPRSLAKYNAVSAACNQPLGVGGIFGVELMPDARRKGSSSMAAQLQRFGVAALNNGLHNNSQCITVL